MSTAPVTPPPAKGGLPRTVVLVCIFIGLAVGVLLAGSAAVIGLSIASADTDRTARTFPAAERLRIEAGGGDVTVVGERRDDVRVEAEIRHTMWREDWKPEIELRGDALRLGNDCSMWIFVGTGECGASYTVRVPYATALAMDDGGSGDRRVVRVAGRVDVETGSGDVELLDASGPLTVDADSGDVDVDAYRGRSLVARADSGDVEVRALRAPSGLRAEADSGDVTVTVPDAAYRVSVATGSGDEDVQLTDDPRAQRTIVIRTGSGDVSLSGAAAGR